MKPTSTPLEGVFIIEPSLYEDERGWFIESYRRDEFNQKIASVDFVQDNQSLSRQAGTLRGLHFQHEPFAQAKLVRCIRGSLLDVCVDLRTGSPSFLKSFSVVLSSSNRKQLFIPKGFAHGFLTLEADTEISYKVDAFYSKEHDAGIHYADPQLAIDWTFDPEITLIVSEKDKALPTYQSGVQYFTYQL